MTIFTDTFMPYEFDNKVDALTHIENRCCGLKKSLRFVSMNKEHLVVRCPLSGDYLDIIGEEHEIEWVHNELSKRRWYRPT